ncbi:hypothetical protein DL96DRAFT_1596549 [Flagelloscypha sp. PMI_526]|nr:hypothetical protein DL96DRAFT_1596549 [Flagelloscypha sp. PMI_526]
MSKSQPQSSSWKSVFSCLCTRSKKDPPVVNKKTRPVKDAPIPTPQQFWDYIENAFNASPSLKAVSDVLVKIISCRERIKVDQAAWGIIIDTVHLYTISIIHSLVMLSKFDGAPSLKSYEADLEAYKQFLESIILKELERCSDGTRLSLDGHTVSNSAGTFLQKFPTTRLGKDTPRTVQNDPLDGTYDTKHVQQPLFQILSGAQQAELLSSIEPFKRAWATYTSGADKVIAGGDLMKIGGLQLAQEDYEAAEASFSRASEMLSEAGSFTGIQVSDRPETARTSYSRALELFYTALKEVGGSDVPDSPKLKRNVQRECALVLAGLGAVQLQLDQLDEAQTSFSQATQTFIDLGDQWNAAYHLKYVGRTQRRRDQFEAAEATFARALEIWPAADGRHASAETQVLLGELHMSAHRLQDAENAFISAFELFTDQKGLFEPARKDKLPTSLNFRQDSALAEQPGRTTALAASFLEAHLSFADVLKLRARLDIAELILTRRIKGSAPPEDMADALVLQASIFRRTSRVQDAIASLKQAIVLYTLSKSKRRHAKTQQTLGELQIERGYWNDAETSLASASQLFTELKALTDLAVTCCLLGDLHMWNDRLDDAEAKIREAFRLFVEIDPSKVPDSCISALGKVWIKQGQLKIDKGEDLEFVRARMLRLLRGV